MPKVLVAAVLAAVVLLGGCIRSYCFRDADCAEGLVCDEKLGTCAEPDCMVDHPDCPRGQVCERRFCVPGCVDASDCEVGQECIDRRCMTVGDECDCPLAPEFCGIDINPNSPTAGEELCVPESFDGGVAIFFGSVFCGHCTANFDALQTRRAELAAEGLDPQLLWLQLKTATPTTTEVGERLGSEATEPVIQDTDAAGLWDLYRTTWYHLVVVDSHGCFLRDFGPLSSTGVDGAEGDEIVDLWRDAMDDVCPAPIDGGDAGTDGGDGGADAPDDAGRETLDADTAIPDDAPTDAGEADATPDEPEPPADAS